MNQANYGSPLGETITKCESQIDRLDSANSRLEDIVSDIYNAVSRIQSFPPKEVLAQKQQPEEDTPEFMYQEDTPEFMYRLGGRLTRYELLSDRLAEIANHLKTIA